MVCSSTLINLAIVTVLQHLPTPALNGLGLEFLFRVSQQSHEAAQPSKEKEEQHKEHSEWEYQHRHKRHLKPEKEKLETTSRNLSLPIRLLTDLKILLDILFIKINAGLCIMKRRNKERLKAE